MKFRYWRVTVLAVVMVLLAPMAAIAADQTVDVQVLPVDTLTIDVENEFGLGVVVPNTMTNERGFHLSIINTSSGGFAVTVEADDLESFEYGNCDEWGCDRVPTDTLYTMGAHNIFMKGGDIGWDDPNPFTFYEGYLTVPPADLFVLLEGTSEAYGEFGIDSPHPSVQVDVPLGQEIAEYWTTLTYTITGT